MNVNCLTLLVLCGLLSLFVVNSDAGRRRGRRRPPRPRPNRPRRFVSCPIPWTISTTSEETVITWNTPRATDDSSSPIVTRTSGPSSGSSLRNGRYDISYTARYPRGSTAACSFSVTVDVIRCPDIPTSSDRWHSCTFGVQGGSQCTYSCRRGYRIMGGATAHCNTSTRQWSIGFPTCQAMTCNPPLSAPIHGSISCSDGNRFMSLCHFHCVEGYEITSGQLSALFCNGRSWSGTSPTCQDVKPPEFTSCPTSFEVNIVQSGVGADKALVTYDSPNAIDNSGHVVIEMTQGKSSGSVFDSGSNLVKYRAQDDAGNVMECNFTINVIIIITG